jgi:hypothetical protein
MSNFKVVSVAALCFLSLLGFAVEARAGANTLYLDGSIVPFDPNASNIYRQLSEPVPAVAEEVVFSEPISAFFLSEPLEWEEEGVASSTVTIWLKGNVPGNVLRPQVVKLAGDWRPNLGDLNCDGTLNQDDVPAFVWALVNGALYQKNFPNCQIENGDINNDGQVDSFDIEGFASLLESGAPSMETLCETEAISIGATSVYTRYQRSCLSPAPVVFHAGERLALILKPETASATYYLSTGVERTNGYSRLEIDFLGESAPGNGGGGSSGGGYSDPAPALTPTQTFQTMVVSLE